MIDGGGIVVGMDIYDKEKRAAFDRVKNAAENLGEHFDSVQIFVTRHAPEDEGTHRIAYGTGNWFARVGQVFTWLQTEKGAMHKQGYED